MILNRAERKGFWDDVIRPVYQEVSLSPDSAGRDVKDDSERDSGNSLGSHSLINSVFPSHLA